MNIKPFLAYIILGIFSTIVFTTNTSSFNIMGQEELKSLNGSTPEFGPPAKSERSPAPPSNDSGIPVIFLNQSSEKKTSEGENQTQSSEKKTSEENQTKTGGQTSEGQNQTDSNKGNIRDNVFKNMTSEGQNQTESATDGK